MTPDDLMGAPGPQMPVEHAEGGESTADKTAVRSSRSTSIPAGGGVVIGFVAELNDQGVPCVAIPGVDESPVPARSLCAIGSEHRGRQCALLFENGDPRAPLILGLLQHPVLSLQGNAEETRHKEDGELHLHARHAIELHCGEASLRMSADGRIELRGSTLISHATGLNRIRGASVKLN